MATTPKSRHQGARRKAVSFKDVARLAGVSTATVSRALSQPERVAAPTLDRVREAVRQLKLVVNVSARALRFQCSHSLLMIAGDPGNPFNGEVIQGALRRAEQLGYTLILSEHDGPPFEVVRKALSSRQVDGVALMWRHLADDDQHHRLQEEFGSAPIVGVRQGMRIPPYPHVSIDNMGAAYALANKVVSLGHRRIAVVRPSGDMEAVEARLDGFRRAFSNATEGPIDAPLLMTELSIEGGRRAAEMCMRLQERPTAILCTNDLIAAGLMSALQSRSISIPNEISVTGFDDLPIVECLSPSLTTIRQPRAGIGSACIDLLIQRLNSPAVPDNIVLSTPLLLRDSLSHPAEE